MDRAEFARLIQALCAVYRQEPSPALLEGFWLGLEGMTLDDVKRALARALRESERFPSPSQLRGLAGEESLESRAVGQWRLVLRAIREAGAYQSVDLGDEATHAAIRALGGWSHLCSQEADELNTYVRKDFDRIYRVCYGQRHGEDGARIEGIHELANKGTGVKLWRLCAYGDAKLKQIEAMQAKQFQTNETGPINSD